MRRIYIFIISIAFLAFLFSCDKIDAPYIEKIDNGGSTDTPLVDVYVQKVLIEDFTGHTCTNCPEAARTLEDIMEYYGDKIVPVAIHVGSFAEPNIPDYPNDYRTTEGTAIESFFNIFGTPLGMVNRIGYPTDQHYLQHTDWSTKAADVLDNTLSLGIKITNTYNQAAGTVDIIIKSTFLSDFNENLKLVVMITEDEIIAPQLDGGVYNPNYVHNHMLRKTVTPNWQGDLIVEGSVAKDQVITKNYNSVDISAWSADNCKVVAYIYYESTYEVINAEFKPVK